MHGGLRQKSAGAVEDEDGYQKGSSHLLSIGALLFLLTAYLLGGWAIQLRRPSPKALARTVARFLGTVVHLQER